ncbi:acyl-CoA dehydrogenase family protein [Novosphingobium resinovorum]|uniref:acyl-CoA dehydrogenase family protein n=1 Tax=Novosphingobium resinovorum TaxID=158500 RepID=UPI002ED02849|nr:acyl-CoA dehydrogenase family protein [Novosphingobium resinovorum]
MTPQLLADTEGPSWITPPEPALTPREMVFRADAMRPELRARQAEAEASGNISAETNQMLIDAGFYRVIQPRMFGGYGFDLPTYVRLITAVARGCPETAWVLSLVLGHVHQLASFSIDAQRDAYGQTGDFRAPEVAAPQGHGVEVAGGYRVSGAWDYASGCSHATHILLTFTVDKPQPGAPCMRMGLFNSADFTIVRNWDVIGMQGTGSDRVVMTNIWVPTHRTKPYPPEPMVLAELYRDHPLFHGPARPFIITESAAVVVGAAQGALDLYEESFHARKPAGPAGGSRTDLAEYQLNFGRCRALVDTARASILHTAERYMAAARRTCETGVPCSDEEARRMTLVILQSIQLANDAVDIIFRTVGTSAAKKGAMLGRCWRNVGVLRGHLAHQSDSAAINYGRAHFGQPTIGIS